MLTILLPNRLRAYAGDALLFAFAIAATLLLSSCDREDRPRLEPQPDRVGGTLPMPTSAPATSEEWTRLTRELDDARAENQRKDAELTAALEAQRVQLQAKIDEEKAANSATWKRLGAYSWMCVAPGIAIIVVSMLPFAAFLAPFRRTGWLLVAIGTAFALLPHIVAEYGPKAFWISASIAGVFAASYGALQLWALWRRLASIEHKAEETTNPVEKVKHAGAAAAVERIIFPAIDKAYKRDLLTVPTPEVVGFPKSARPSSSPLMLVPPPEVSP